MEVNVASHGTMETQTESNEAKDKSLEVDNLRKQANQLMQDLSSLQKLKDDIEQQKAKVEQEREEFKNAVYEKENITRKLLREKREVVAMNNQLNLEIERVIAENRNLWEKEGKTESLRNFDTVQDFQRELDQRLEVAIPSLPAVQDTEEKTQSGDVVDEAVASGSIRTDEGLRIQAIQPILLQLQEQQEENQKLLKEVATKGEQVGLITLRCMILVALLLWMPQGLPFFKPLI